MQNFLVRNTGLVEYLRGVGKCDRLYERDCLSEYQILVEYLRGGEKMRSPL
ncbi:hypothetical protein [Cylindrospermopsis raciborskii]|uniref:hypothetical protein n=1 Tax=Cylindrospermopsis raciborskii TaxID=77022 RepID=UPI001F3BFAB7|nr:hypothetical protein [Cylindrospermopsis raciborskii]UJS04474.1 hypothetical protein L3I90_15590 [Cylindrospermopsis raciborskii KLL07]